MSLLPNAVYANPSTPCWEPDTTGGGLNPTFTNVTINQGGAITMGSSITEGTQMFWNKNLAGTTYTQMVMGYDEPATGALSLTFLDETNDYDRLKVGNVYAFGDGTAYGGAAPQIVLGNASGALGLALKNGTTGTVTPVISQSSPSVTTFDLSNIKTLNSAAGTLAVPATIQATTYSADLSGIQVVQPKVQYGIVTTSGSSGSTTITLSNAYASVSSYVALPIMEDTSPAEMSAQRTSDNTFDVYWAQAGVGSHTIAWATFGL
jgi:hypothetical protein